MNPAPEIMRKVKGQGQWSIYHRVPSSIKSSHPSRTACLWCGLAWVIIPPWSETGLQTSQIYLFVQTLVRLYLCHAHSEVGPVLMFYSFIWGGTRAPPSLEAWSSPSSLSLLSPW